MPQSPSGPGRPPVTVTPDAQRQAVLAAYRERFLPLLDVPVQWTGRAQGCVAGASGAAHQQAVLDAVNYFRALAGLPADVRLNADYSAKAQAAALLVHAARDVSHFPPSDAACYSPAAAEGARRSNLGLGVHGARAVVAYMEERGIPDLGHRRWILFSRLTQIGTGDTDDSNALWLLGDFAATVPAAVPVHGIAWPPRGFVPWSEAVATPEGFWSFGLPDADFSGARVQVRDASGRELAVTLTTPHFEGYGDNTLAWTVARPPGGWPVAAGELRLQVTVDGVRAAGTARRFDYEVAFVRP